jgi:hypothetical protein
MTEYLERNIYAMEKSGYTVEEVQKVLSENADRAFKIDPVVLSEGAQ